MFLWHVKLALLLETRACVALAQGLEGRPMLGELLRDTLLGRDDGWRLRCRQRTTAGVGVRLARCSRTAARGQRAEGVGTENFKNEI